MIALEAFSAAEGDALLLHYEDESGPRYAIIDGGPAGTFTEVMADRLSELDATGDGLRIEFVMVSHVDSDHVDGLLDWFDAMVAEDAGPSSDVLFWNSPRAMPPPTQPAGGNAAPNPLAALEKLIAKLQVPDASAVTPESYPTGTQLDGLAVQLNMRINPPHHARILAGNVLPANVVAPLEITAVGPPLKVLEKMLAQWQAAAPIDVTPVSIDTSAKNLSSLTVFVDAGNATTLLLCGDARADHILEGLREAKMPATEDAPLHVSVLKVPHHGSDRNLFSGEHDTWKFFESVTADHYVFSADGRHQNPSVRSVKHVVEVNKDRKCTMWFTTDPKTLSGPRAVEYKLALKKTKAAIKHHKAKIKVRHPQNGEPSVIVEL